MKLPPPLGEAVLLSEVRLLVVRVKWFSPTLSSLHRGISHSLLLRKPSGKARSLSMPSTELSCVLFLACG